LIYAEVNNLVLQLKILTNECKVELSHLGLTKSGNPLHPSARGRSQCIPYGHKPINWKEA